MESSLGKMEPNMKVNISMTRRKAQANSTGKNRHNYNNPNFLLGQLVKSTTVNGRMENNMVKESSLTLTEWKEKVNGRTETTSSWSN
jgi:hypothetical protein